MNCPELDEDIENNAIERLLCATYLVDIADESARDAPQQAGKTPQLTEQETVAQGQMPAAVPAPAAESSMKERLGAEGHSLKKDNPDWTHDDIAKEIVTNRERAKRLRCEHLTEGSVKRYLRGQGIGKRCRPTSPKE